mmetsp:Transcript_14655/g.45433  ORF Transcript_14655/g.45433 Transcript_14655/m.45433 type:complete len:213 (-) Transcript_14655:180-818(-)
MTATAAMSMAAAEVTPAEAEMSSGAAVVVGGTGVTAPGGATAVIVGSVVTASVSLDTEVYTPWVDDSHEFDDVAVSRLALRVVGATPADASTAKSTTSEPMYMFVIWMKAALATCSSVARSAFTAVSSAARLPVSSCAKALPSILMVAVMAATKLGGSDDGGGVATGAAVVVVAAGIMHTLVSLAPNEHVSAVALRISHVRNEHDFCRPDIA